MKRVLHIFAKDTRRLWPEILLSFATLAAFILVFPMQWTETAKVTLQHQSETVNKISMLLHDCVIAILIGWCLLITRVIHADPVLGTRQFWITRPYGWKQLLGAKLLFAIAFVLAPLLLTQGVSYLTVGLNPLSAIPDTLRIFALVAGLIVMPLFAIGCLTASIASTIVAALAILLLCSAGTILWEHNPLYENQTWLDPSALHASLSVFAVCLVVIVMQYKLRRPLLGWIILLAGAAFPIWGYWQIAIHYDKQWWRSFDEFDSYQILKLKDLRGGLAHMYPPIPNETRSPIQLALVHDPRFSAYAQGVDDRKNRKDVWVKIPVEFSGVAPGVAIHLDDVIVSLEAANGFHWTGPWKDDGVDAIGSLYPKEYLSGTYRRYLQFPMAFDVYDRLKDSSITVRVALYYAELQQTDSVTASFPDKLTEIPGVGNCIPSSADSAALTCLTTERFATITRTNVELSDSPCPPSHPERKWLRGEQWLGLDYGIEQLRPGLATVKENTVYFSPGNPKLDDTLHFCTGQPVTFTHYRFVRRVDSSFIFPDFHFPANPKS